MKSVIKRSAAALLAAVMLVISVAGCAKKEEKKKIIIYTSAENYRIDYMQSRLDERFPDYEIILDYRSSGDHAALLKASGMSADCHITHDLEYGYAEELARLGFLADLSGKADLSVYAEDTVKSSFYLPEVRNGGAIILNMDVFEEKELDVPQSYEDLLDPQYKGLISMPSPSSSGTGYMFLLSLVNAWGEEEAFDYFDKLSENILSFTSSGSGPVNALVQGEVAIGLGITANAVTKINEGANLKPVFFEEGSPYTMYGQGVIAGRETDTAVMEVFGYLSTELTREVNCLYFPERIFKDATVEVKNFPTDITYADMSDNTPERKDELLAKWNH